MRCRRAYLLLLMLACGNAAEGQRPLAAPGARVRFVAKGASSVPVEVTNRERHGDTLKLAATHGTPPEVGVILGLRGSW